MVSWTTSTLCVNDFGSGSRTLLILPGASLHSVMLSADAVAAAFAAFASEYTVCLFDLRRELPPGFGIRQMAQDTAALCDHLGIVRADVFKQMVLSLMANG